MSLLTGLERNMKCYKKEFDENADSSSLVWDRMFMFIICKRIRSIFLIRKNTSGGAIVSIEELLSYIVS